MAGTTNQKIKLLGIINILRKKTDSSHGITLDDLVKELEETYNVTAERKSLYKDFQKLEELGYDVTKSKKNRTYYYYLLSREFENAELKILIDTVQFSKFITPSKKKKLIDKLLNLTSIYGAEELKDQIYIDEIVKVKNDDCDLKWNEKIYYNVDRLYRAINKKLQVQFHYICWDTFKQKNYKRKGKLYVQSPFYLVEKNENYYLIAYDEKAGFIKHFRVDKMEDIEILDKSTVGEEKFNDVDVNTYCQKRFSMFGGKERQVTLKFKNELVGAAFDLFGHEIEIENQRKNTFEITVDIVPSSQFFGWVFSNLGNVQIVGPNDIINEFIGYIRQIRAQYNYVDGGNGFKYLVNKAKIREIKEDKIKEEKEKKEREKQKALELIKKLEDEADELKVEKIENEAEELGVKLF